MTFPPKNYQQFSDEKLMELLNQRETAAFDELYKRYSTRLLHYFHRMLGGDEEKAQDFLQDLFLKIVEGPASFDTRKRFCSWVFTVAHNMCKNEYRHLAVRKSAGSDLNRHMISQGNQADYHFLEREFDNREFTKALLTEVEKLGRTERSTFLLRYQENLSIKEISEILDCSEGTVKSRLFYINKKLAGKLKALDPHQA